jgi:hypothetical protein
LLFVLILKDCLLICEVLAFVISIKLYNSCEDIIGELSCNSEDKRDSRLSDVYDVLGTRVPSGKVTWIYLFQIPLQGRILQLCMPSCHGTAQLTVYLRWMDYSNKGRARLVWMPQLRFLLAPGVKFPSSYSVLLFTAS